MSNKKCPYYQGLCGLDKEEKTLCYTDAPECDLYQTNIKEASMPEKTRNMKGRAYDERSKK